MYIFINDISKCIYLIFSIEHRDDHLIMNISMTKHETGFFSNPFLLTCYLFDIQLHYTMHLYTFANPAIKRVVTKTDNHIPIITSTLIA